MTLKISNMILRGGLGVPDWDIYWGIIWGMSGASSGACLGHVWSMSGASSGACLGHVLGMSGQWTMDNNGQQSVVLHASVMPFFIYEQPLMFCSFMLSPSMWVPLSLDKIIYRVQRHFLKRHYHGISYKGDFLGGGIIATIATIATSSLQTLTSLGHKAVSRPDALGEKKRLT